MAVSLDVLDAHATLADLQKTLRQTEELGFQLVSITIGIVGGTPASLVTFSQSSAGNPPTSISLEIVDGGLNKDQQEAALNGSGKPVVCYGSLFVEGQRRNVAAYRA